MFLCSTNYSTNKKEEKTCERNPYKVFVYTNKSHAACVQGCVKDRSPGLEGLFNFQVHEAEEL